MIQLDMANSLHAFLLEGTQVKRIEDNKYEVVTPYTDTRGRISLYASVDGDRIRLSDGGYLTENYLRHQDTNSPFLVHMGVEGDGSCEGNPRLEDGEFVIDCTIETFGENVVLLAHGIIIIGTSKNTMMMMIQVFKQVMGPPPDLADLAEWLPEGPKYEA